MKFKPSLLVVVKLFTCFTILTSCSKEKFTNPDNSNSSNLPLSSAFAFSELNFIGENHNSLLDYVKDNLNLSNASKYDRYMEAKKFTGSTPNWSSFEGTSEIAYNHAMESGWATIAEQEAYLDPALTHYLDTRCAV